MVVLFTALFQLMVEEVRFLRPDRHRRMQDSQLLNLVDACRLSPSQTQALTERAPTYPSRRIFPHL